MSPVGIVGSFLSRAVREVLVSLGFKAIAYQVDPIVPCLGSDAFTAFGPLRPAAAAVRSLRPCGRASTPRRPPVMTVASQHGVRPYRFLAGDSRPWRIDRLHTVAGEPLPVAVRLAIDAGPAAGARPDAVWQLLGITSDERYVQRDEQRSLVNRQPGLGRGTGAVLGRSRVR